MHMLVIHYIIMPKIQNLHILTHEHLHGFWVPVKLKAEVRFSKFGQEASHRRSHKWEWQLCLCDGYSAVLHTSVEVRTGRIMAGKKEYIVFILKCNQSFTP
jgi:hypothetical protein